MHRIGNISALVQVVRKTVPFSQKPLTSPNTLGSALGATLRSPFWAQQVTRTGFQAMVGAQRLFSQKTDSFSSAPKYTYKLFENQNREVPLIARANSLSEIIKTAPLEGHVGLEIALPFVSEMSPEYIAQKMDAVFAGMATKPNIWSLKEMSGSSSAAQIGAVIRAMILNLAEKYPKETYPELWETPTAMAKNADGQHIISRDVVRFIELLRDWSQSVFSTRINVKSPLVSTLLSYLGWMKSAHLVMGIETSGGTSMQIDELFMQRNFEGTVQHEAAQLAPYGLSGRSLVRATTGHNMVDLVTRLFTHAMSNLAETFVQSYLNNSTESASQNATSQDFLAVALHFHNQFKNAFPESSLECDAAIAAAIVETATLRAETGFVGARIIVDLLVGSRAYGFSSLLDVETQLQHQGYTLHLTETERQCIQHITVVERLTEIAYEAARVPNDELPPEIVKKANIAGGATGPIVSDIRGFYEKAKPRLAQTTATPDPLGLPPLPTHPRNKPLEPQFLELLQLYADESAKTRKTLLPQVSPVTPGQANLHKYTMDLSSKKLGFPVNAPFSETNNWNEWIRPGEFPGGKADKSVLEPVLKSRMQALLIDLRTAKIPLLASHDNPDVAQKEQAIEKALIDMVMSPKPRVQAWMQAQGVSEKAQEILLNIVDGESIPECLTKDNASNTSAPYADKVPANIPDHQKEAWARMATRHGSPAVPTRFYNPNTKAYPKPEIFSEGPYEARRRAYQNAVKSAATPQQQGGTLQHDKLHHIALEGDDQHIGLAVDHQIEVMFSRFDKQIPGYQLAAILTAKLQRDAAKTPEEKQQHSQTLQAAFYDTATHLATQSNLTREPFLNSYTGHVFRLWISAKEKETVNAILADIPKAMLCTAVTQAANRDLGLREESFSPLEIDTALETRYSPSLIAATSGHRENHLLDLSETVLGRIAQTYNGKTPEDIRSFIDTVVTNQGLSEDLIQAHIDRQQA